MEYGLRRYEAIQRLFWFVFFILCLVAANFSQGFTTTPKSNLQIKDLKKLEFWLGLQGVQVLPAETTTKGKLDAVDLGSAFGKTDAKRSGTVDKKPSVSSVPAESDDTHRELQLLGSAFIFLVGAGMIFLELKLIWLLIQYAGRYLLQWNMSGIGEPGRVRPELVKANPELIFPRQELLRKIRRIPGYFLLHPFMRLRLMLSGNQNVASEQLVEKERRIVETDWQVLYSSWGLFRWLFWILPLLGLAQTSLLFLFQIKAASLSQKEILDTVQSMPSALLPVLQAAGVVIFFKAAMALFRRLEELYLSNLDALIYDKLLSRLPLQSNDTVIILETIHGQFKELHTAIKRLEEKINPIKKTEGKLL